MTFYIRAWGYSGPIFDFTLNIDEYIASNNVNNPKPVAPDATASPGPTPNSEEYRLPAVIDNDILTVNATELWAKVYWPADFSGGPYPLVVFLHGNHKTCGRIGTSPRIDDNIDYTSTGACPTGYTVVNNHLGFEYLATQLASRGYIVASINANRGITGIIPPDPTYPDDPLHIFSRGRLVLKHLETLSKWNIGPTAFITDKTLGTSRKNATAWFGMQITVGAQAITVYSLGRIFVTGNNQTHTLEIVRASDSVVVASVAISMTGGTSGQFKYLNLASPVRLAANTSYYVVSQETKNKDSWYDSNTTVSSTPLANVNGRVTSSNGTSWDTSGAVPGNVYVPVDLRYQVLSVNLTGKIDFTNVGLMGHSRGGQGVLAAYNLYRTPSIDPRATPADITWSSRIPGMNIKGIFEIAPTDFFLPTASDGTGSQYLNGDGSALNVLLPVCDGDVSNLQGIRVFDRTMAFTGNNIGVPADTPATQKSTYSVWGANHDFFNTEWQQTDSQGCKGSGNTRLFPFPVTDGSGSPNQRTTGSASVLAFFRANVGTSPSTSFNQNFNPRYDHPGVITSIVPPLRIDRGFTPSPNSSITKVVFDFPANLPPNSSYVYTDPDVAFNNASAIPEQDYVTNPFPCYAGPNPPPCPAPSPIAQVLTAGDIKWQAASCNNYFQAEWTPTGESIGGYQTLDFRVSRQIDSIRNSSDSTNFQIQLIAGSGSPTGAAMSLNKYLMLTGPVGLDDGSLDGFLHPILQTVRIPLSDFTGANLSNVRGVRFVFSDTPKGAIYLGNIRLSNQ